MENSFQKRFEEIIRIANILYPTLQKSTMEVIKCNGRNSNRKFRSFIKDQFTLPSHVFRVRTFSNVHTAIAESPSRVTPFYP